MVSQKYGSSLLENQYFECLKVLQNRAGSEVLLNFQSLKKYQPIKIYCSETLCRTDMKSTVYEDKLVWLMMTRGWCDCTALTQIIQNIFQGLKSVQKHAKIVIFNWHRTTLLRHLINFITTCSVLIPSIKPWAWEDVKFLRDMSTFKNLFISSYPISFITVNRLINHHANSTSFHIYVACYTLYLQ